MFKRFDLPLVFSVVLLLLASVVILGSIAPGLFPAYFIYLGLALAAFLFFSKVDFEIISLFAPHLYLVSLLLLLLTLVIGQVTRGAIRWIPLGNLTLQAAELIRPFLLVFWSRELVQENLGQGKFFRIFIFFLIPFFLILIQPSLGVAALTAVGFLGVLLASSVKKSHFLWLSLIFTLALPLAWQLAAPYQKARITTFFNPFADPQGKGYNAIQAMISVGSGRFFGRGLGKGVQTQLAFLPEKQTDFVFASIAEELGFLGAGLVLAGIFMVLWRLTIFLENSVSPAARAFNAGLFLTLLIQTMVHVGMNMGLVPITGVPLPLVSAGGNSLLATLIGLGIAQGTRRS